MHPFNGIQIPPIRPGGGHRENPDIKDLEDSNDDELLQLIEWFESVDIKNVDNYVSLTKPWLLGPQY